MRGLPRIWKAVLNSLNGLMLLGPIGLVLILLIQVMPRQDFFAWPITAIVMVGGIYVLSHCLRAVRLAVIAMPILGLSGRTVCLLHLVTAPAAIVLPFKLGEVVRLQQLWWMTGNPSGALTAVLLERIFDAAMLLLLLVYLFANGQIESLGGWIWFITVATVIVATIVFVVGPTVLATLQTYIVINHRQTRSLRQLARVDGLRQIVDQATGLVRTHGMVIAVLSLMIWGLEVSIVILFLNIFLEGSEVLSPGVVLAERIQIDAMIMLQTMTPPIAITLITLCAITLVWPMAYVFYARRRWAEPLRRAIPRSRASSFRNSM